MKSVFSLKPSPSISAQVVEHVHSARKRAFAPVGTLKSEYVGTDVFGCFATK
jgi:hypothetical protein